MSDELPQMPRRPLLDTYAQRFMRLGGRILVVTVIVGAVSGYVGGRAFDAVQRANEGANANGNANGGTDGNGNGGANGNGGGETDDDLLDWDWDGVYSGFGESNAGAIEDVLIEIEKDILRGSGRVAATAQGYTGGGTVDFDGTVSRTDRNARTADVSGRITGSIPAARGSVHGAAAVDARFTGKVDGTQLKIDFSGTAADVDIWGSILLDKSGQAPDRNW